MVSKAVGAGPRPVGRVVYCSTIWLFPVAPSDRHRGGGHPPTPATPPCVRVRTRRFELVALERIEQRWKTERFEVRIGKPHRQGLGLREVPRAAPAAGRIAGQSRADPE